MAKELTPRQQEIKALTEQGMNAPKIAKKLKITENAVYQHLRAIRGGAKKSSSSRPKRRTATARRQSSRTRTPAPAVPAAPATAEELLRQEIDGAQAGVSDLKGQIKAHQDEITQAEKQIEALTAEAERKGDVLAVLTGKKVARDKPKPTAARKRSSAATKATGQSGAGKGTQAASGSQAPSQAPSNGGAASTPAPASQAEREATADHDGPTAPAPDPAPATA
jgi:chromosome segregation ATPase